MESPPANGFASAAALQILRDRVVERSRSRDATPICLFLGAGADISSGGMTFRQFKRLTVEDALNERFFATTSDEEIEEQFERLFMLNAAPDDRARLVDRIFHQMEVLQPSDAYKLLVLLGEAGAIDSIITTNFDVMLEKAESLLGCDVYQVFAAGVARPFLTPTSPNSPKRPYVKLHGDLASRAVSHVTATELRVGNHDPSLIDLLRRIIATHDVVLAGYSGQDEALANIMGDAFHDSTHGIFWCDPRPPAPGAALSLRMPDRCRFINSTFDGLIMHIAEPVLRKPRIAPKKPTYIRCVFEWRVENCNQTFFREYGQRLGSPVVDLAARRPYVESTLRTFLDSDRPMAIVAGPSGYGKTTLGIRLYDTWSSHPTRKVILLTAKSLGIPELEFHLAERLGGLGPSVPLSMASLEGWLREVGLQLVVFVDGLNEYSTDLNDCARLLRNIVRLCYYLPEHRSAIRIVATIRQETWNSVLPRLDGGALREALWSPSGIVDAIEAVSIGPLTDDELKEALERLRACGRTDLRYDSLSPTAVDRLRDPFLLSAVANSGRVASLTGPTFSIYARVYRALLANNGGALDPATLEDALARLALQALNTGSDTFRPVDLTPADARAAMIRATKDLGILVDTDDGFLRFRHDRLQEYFLSVGLGLPDAPGLRSLEQLRDYLARTHHNAKARAAARMYFAGVEGRRFELIEEAMLLPSAAYVSLSAGEQELVFSFAREVVYELTESNPVLAARYIRSAIRATRDRKLQTAQLRSLVQSAAGLPDDAAVPALAMASVTGDDLAATEADVYATDKLLRRYLKDGCPDIDICTSGPYEAYFADTSLSPWRQMGRVTRLLTQAGPDNLHASEHTALIRAVSPGLSAIAARAWSVSDFETLRAYLVGNCDRLLFNCTASDVDDFFANPERGELARVLSDLVFGETLAARHLDTLNRYIQSMDFTIKPFNVEYNVCTLFFLLSAINNVSGTLHLWETRFASFTDATPAVEVDFYQGVLVCIHIALDLAYDERFAQYEERVLRDWPTVLKCRPGLSRGLRRGFQDEFDMIFEDGFGVVYPYGILMPSRRRRGQTYIQYRQSFAQASREYPLPLYSNYIRRYLNDDRIDDAIQLLQALRGVIVAWPLEGLATLRDAIGHPDPSVHRAIVRVLAESYSRHPLETVGFLRMCGGALGDDDLQQIKIRQDHRIGRAQVAMQEWARLAHYLLTCKGAARQIATGVRHLLTAVDFPTAIYQIVLTLGIQTHTGR